MQSRRNALFGRVALPLIFAAVATDAFAGTLTATSACEYLAGDAFYNTCGSVFVSNEEGASASATAAAAFGFLSIDVAAGGWNSTSNSETVGGSASASASFSDEFEFVSGPLGATWIWFDIATVQHYAGFCGLPNIIMDQEVRFSYGQPFVLSARIFAGCGAFVSSQGDFEGSSGSVTYTGVRFLGGGPPAPAAYYASADYHLAGATWLGPVPEPGTAWIAFVSIGAILLLRKIPRRQTLALINWTPWAIAASASCASRVASDSACPSDSSRYEAS